MTRSDSEKRLTPQEAYSQLADRCAACEMCTGEALDRLRRRGIDEDSAFDIVQRLVDLRFIDDERFARIWVRDRLWNARWGLLKIRNDMRLKRIDDAIISSAINEELDRERYFDNLAAALRSKARTLPSPLTYDLKMKLARFAISRGYEPSLVQEMLRDEEYWRTDEAD